MNIIKNTQIARVQYDKLYPYWSASEEVLEEEHVKALRDGKCIAIYDGESVTFLTMSNPWTLQS